MKDFNDRFYPETISLDHPVLKNTLNIKNNKDLEEAELKMSVPKIYLIDKKTVPGKWDLKHLMDYHKFIFGSLYEWAGEIRQHGVEKYEEVLSGGSVNYTEPLLIVPRIKNTLDIINKKNIKEMNTKEQADLYCDALVDVWESHPFNEGNTRCVTKFMVDLFRAKGMKMDVSLFTDNAEYYRKAMVVYTFGNEKYLKQMVMDSAKLYK